MITKLISSWLASLHFLSDKLQTICAEILSVILLSLCAYLVAKAVQCLVLFVINRAFLCRRIPRLCDAMRATHIPDAFGFAISAVVVFHLYGFFLPVEGALLQHIMARVVGIFFVLCFMHLICAIVNVIDYLYGKNPKVPLRGVFQATKIIVYLLAALIIVCIIISKKPMYVLTGLSAAAAVFMLVFKDPILGFAAGIQLASNKLLKIGDWITMPSHGADGTVIDITLTTVRVQNFDNTIISVPAYDLISKPFQNWSGMVQSGARRIQRAVYVDVQTIQFLDKEMFKRLSKIQLLGEYLAQKAEEIRAFNAQHRINENVINGRHLTNIGTFRQYAVEYLRSLPTVDHKQTCMVRQLSAGSSGLPLEIYCFASTTDWIEYEGIQSDIFDHLYSVMPEFGLYPFQQPAGRNVSTAFAQAAASSAGVK